MIQRIAHEVLSAGGIVEADAKNAEIILRVASGALSIDRREFLVGIPGIPLPIPSVGTFQTPELALFKIILNRGKAKLLFDVVDPKTNAQLWAVPTCYGLTRTDFVYVLFTGPWKSSDVPESRQEPAK